MSGIVGGVPSPTASTRPLQKLPALKTPNIAAPSSPGSVKRPPPITRPTLPPLQRPPEQNGTSNGLNGHADDNVSSPTTLPTSSTPTSSSESVPTRGPPVVPAFVRPSSPATNGSAPSDDSPKATHKAFRSAPPPAINPATQNPASPSTNGAPPPTLPPFKATPMQLSTSGPVPTKHPALSAPPPKLENGPPPSSPVPSNGGWGVSPGSVKQPAVKAPPPKVPDFVPVEEEDFDDDFSFPEPVKIPPILPPISTVRTLLYSYLLPNSSFRSFVLLCN